MQSKLNAYLITLVGILLALPLLGVTALGDIMTGITAWAVAIIILIIGIVGIVKTSK